MDVELQKDIAIEMHGMTCGFVSSLMAKRLGREVKEVSDALKDMFYAGQIGRVSVINEQGTFFYIWFAYEVLPQRVLDKLDAVELAQAQQTETELSAEDATRVIQFLEQDLKPAAVVPVERRRPPIVPDVIEVWKLPAHLGIALIHLKNAARWPEEARAARRWLLRFMQHKGIK